MTTFTTLGRLLFAFGLAGVCEAFVTPGSIYHGHSYRLSSVSGLERPVLPSMLLSLTSSVEVEVNGGNGIVTTDTEEDDDVQMRLIEAVQRAESLKMQLQTKEAQYQALIKSMESEMKKNEMTLTDRIQDFANQLQQLRFDSHKQLMQTKQSAEQREMQLRTEIQALQKEVDKAQDEAQKAQAASHEMMSKRMDLEKELGLLKNKYATDLQDWEDRMEHEQDTRRKEEQTAAQKLEAAILDGKLQVRMERERLTTEIERMRTDMTYRLTQKESELGEVRRVLEQKEQELLDLDLRIRDLQAERASLRKLAKLSWQLSTSRFANRLKRIAGRGETSGK